MSDTTNHALASVHDNARRVIDAVMASGADYEYAMTAAAELYEEIGLSRGDANYHAGVLASAHRLDSLAPGMVARGVLDASVEDNVTAVAIALGVDRRSHLDLAGAEADLEAAIGRRLDEEWPGVRLHNGETLIAPEGYTGSLPTSEDLVTDRTIVEALQGRALSPAARDAAAELMNQLDDPASEGKLDWIGERRYAAQDAAAVHEAHEVDQVEAEAAPPQGWTVHHRLDATVTEAVAAAVVELGFPADGGEHWDVQAAAGELEESINDWLEESYPDMDLRLVNGDTLIAPTGIGDHPRAGEIPTKAGLITTQDVLDVLVGHAFTEEAENAILAAADLDAATGETAEDATSPAVATEIPASDDLLADESPSGAFTLTDQHGEAVGHGVRLSDGAIAVQLHGHEADIISHKEFLALTTGLNVTSDPAAEAPSEAPSHLPAEEAFDEGVEPEASAGELRDSRDGQTAAAAEHSAALAHMDRTVEAAAVPAPVADPPTATGPTAHHSIGFGL